MKTAEPHKCHMNVSNQDYQVTPMVEQSWALVLITRRTQASTETVEQVLMMVQALFQTWLYWCPGTMTLVQTGCKRAIVLGHLKESHAEARREQGLSCD